MQQIFSAVFLCFFFVSTSAQFSFSDQTEIYLDSKFPYKSQIVAITDMDNDGLDDIAILEKVPPSGSGLLKINYQNEPNTPFSCKSLANIGSSNQFSICAADLNNNGQIEAIIGGLYETSEIIATTNMDGDTSIFGFLPISENVFFQGTNIVDVNNDGLLDVFACHDEGANYLWENEGDGQFKVNNDWIDFSINGSQGEPASGNYGSIWSDVDFDGDIDLYIAKCRHNVADSTDVRRINQLYINNGDGTFSEMASEAGLAIGWQSWTADFQDINNDGYFDVFVTNHDHESQILLNNGNGVFTEIPNTGINITEKVFQGLLRDFDNDGWNDIIVAGRVAQFFINNRDSTFTEIFGPWTDEPVHNFAIGDLNGDGFIDAYAGYRWGGDKIWINTGESENNFLSVGLKGTISNKSAIGSRLEIYGDWGIQIREVRSGESYGIMNSMTQYVGLGKSEYVDSVIVRWPSGIVQTEYNINVNSKIMITEKCTFEAPMLNIKKDLILCLGDSVTLKPDGVYQVSKWNNGSNSSEIVVVSSGSYYVELTDSVGCTTISSTINIQFESELTPSIEAFGDQEICVGEEALLITTHQYDVDNQSWSDGSTGDTLIVSESGDYTFIQENVCGTYTSNQIQITVYEIPLAPITYDDTIVKDEVAILVADGTGISWYVDDMSPIVVGTGNEFEVLNLEVSTSFYASQSLGNGLCESQRAPARVIIEEGLSTDQVNSEQVIKLSPNPVHEILNIQINEGIDLPYSFEIYDLNSSLVSQKSLNELESTIDVSGFKKGVYIIFFESNNFVFAERFIVF